MVIRSDRRRPADAGRWAATSQHETMEAKAEIIDSKQFLKWGITYVLGIFGELYLQGYGLHKVYATVITYLILAPLAYWVPPKTSVSYAKFSCYVVLLLGWYALIMRHLLDWLTQRFSFWLAIVCAWAVFYGPVIIVVTKLLQGVEQAKTNREPGSNQ